MGSKVEEVHQQPSISIIFLPVPHLVKMNSIFGQHLQPDCFEKPPQSLCPCHQTIETEGR